MRIAVIDLGSNAVRMTVADVEGKNVNIIKQLRDNVRLSENMSETSMLQIEPVKRTVNALKEFNDIALSLGAEKIVAVATAAMRNAKNPEVIVNPLSDMGIKLEIIEGLKEAYYDYLGVINTTDVNNCVIIDIGGASTEIILVKDKNNVGMISLDLGAVTLTEKYIKDQDFSGCTKEAMEYVREVLNEVDFLKEASGFDIIALGGTARSFGQIDLNNNEVAPGHIIKVSRIAEIIKKVDGMTLEEIKQNIAIEKKRADIIKGGFAIISCLIEKIDAPKIIVSRSGVREGVLYDIAR